MNYPNQTLLPNQQEQYCMIRMAMAKWHPNGKTHFTEKPGKNNVVNTSKNGPSSNLFKITSWLCNKPNSKLETDYFFTD